MNSTPEPPPARFANLRIILVGGFGLVGAIAGWAAMYPLGVQTHKYFTSLYNKSPQFVLKDSMNEDVLKIKQTLPKHFDDGSTLFDIKMNDMTIVYSYKLDNGTKIIDEKLLVSNLKSRVCAGNMKDMTRYGVSYKYEFWTFEQKPELLREFIFKTCDD